MPQPIRIGIIGCGVIAPTHIESFQKIPGVEVVWACDLKRDRAEKIAQRYNIPRTTTDVQQVLADPEVDAVSICTDHASHSAIAVAAVAAGKHILCEKCLTANGPQLDAMLSAHAARPDLKFAGVFQHRFDAINRRVRQIVQEGRLGQVLTASAKLRCHRPDSYYADDWHGTWDREGGSVLINQAIHFVDQVQWIMGGVESIAAMYANLAHPGHMETEDTLTATLRFRNGALGTLDLTNGSHLNWDFGVTFYGSAGTLELRNDKLQRVECKDPGRAAELRQYIEAVEFDAGVDGAAEHYGKGHAAQIQDFVAAIRDNRAPYCTVQQAAETAQLVFAAYESARARKWVDLPAAVVSV